MGEWVYERFDRIPAERDTFRCGDLEVTVSDMRQNRIVKLIVKIPCDDGAEGGGAE